jgi:hypothetical protein
MNQAIGDPVFISQIRFRNKNPQKILQRTPTIPSNPKNSHPFKAIIFSAIKFTTENHKNPKRRKLP